MTKTNKLSFLKTGKKLCFYDYRLRNNDLLKFLKLHVLFPFIGKLQNISTPNSTFYKNMEKMPEIEKFKVKLTIPPEISYGKTCLFILLNFANLSLFKYQEKSNNVMETNF